MWPKSKIVQLLWFSQGKNKVSNVLYRSIHIVFVYFQRWEQNSWESVGRMSWMSFTLSSGTEKRNSQQLTEVVWVLKLILRQYSQQYYLFSYRYVIMIIYIFFLQRCHEPRVVDSEVNDPRHVWYCVQCVRRMREMVFLIYVLLLCTQILSKFFC